MYKDLFVTGKPGKFEIWIGSSSTDIRLKKHLISGKY
jgi:hypothetical protein